MAVLILVPNFLSHYSDGTGLESENGKPLRLYVANVLTHNKQHQKLADELTRVKPDVVLLLEINNEWVSSLNQLERIYPYSKFAPRSDNFGIGLLSRLPLDKVLVGRLSETDIPSIEANINIASPLIGTHPLPPVGVRQANLRDDQLRALGIYAKSLSMPVIIGGDLNTSVWANSFKLVSEPRELVDAALFSKTIGARFLPTWPTNTFFFGIRLDHILVSKEIAVQDWGLGGDIGSDVVSLASKKIEMNDEASS